MVVFAYYTCEDCLNAGERVNSGKYRTCSECGGRMKRVENPSDAPAGFFDKTWT